MFENYKATKRDFKAIEEGIKTVWRKEMDFVFKKGWSFERIVIISFDSRNLYFWSTFKIPKLKELPCHFKKYYLFKKSHRIKITDEMQMGWRANAYYFYQYLPKILEDKAYISGGLLTPFTKIHQKYIKSKNKEKKYWAKTYSTYESYLATLVHEFGHIYYNSQPLSISNKRANLNYLKTASNLFKGRKIEKFSSIKFYRSFAFEAWTEIFAFCAEYYAAYLFWPRFKKDLDSYLKANLTRLGQNPSLLTSRDPHNLAAVIGKILMSHYPKDWPEKIFNF